LAAVFAASATAFAVLKVLGATYLAYLAWGAFRAPVSPASMGARPAATPLQMFSRGIVMNLTNPKVVFFFLALLPQFVQAESGSVTLQLCALGLIFILATLVAFGTITYFSAAFSAGLRQSARAQRGLNYFAGSIFLGLAVRLALTER
jgi:threonine/homoserine/homoserine lactone efflux protein